MKENSTTTRGLDRSSILRGDRNWLIDKFHDDKSCIIPVHNLTVLCDNSKEFKAVPLTYGNFINFQELIQSYIFLGIYDDTPCFAIDIASNELASNLCQQTGAIFHDLSSVVSLLDSRSCELLSLARFMIYWHSRNQYCGKCGNKTKRSEAGHVRICQNKSCKEYYFPSMDPAIIVLVSSGMRCLLGRQKDWRKGMYATLAGFVEPGEAIEDAVVREIKEETGVNIHDVKYHHSQSWLFPRSLMLGFTATTKDEKIIVDKNELEDACWFTKDEIKLNPHILPHKASIAYKLIMEWLNNDS
jgi:NAD+ diphosphatase